MRSSKTGHKTSSVASAVWHVSSSCEQKYFRNGPITIAIDCNGLCLLIFEKSPNYVSGPKSAPNSDTFWVLWLFTVCVRVFCALNATILLVYSGSKSAPNSDSFWVRRLFNVCVRVFCAPNATILLVYIRAKIKMSFIWKDYSSVSRSQAHLSKGYWSVYTTTIFVRWKD